MKCDSKSPAFAGVAVRVRPPVPETIKPEGLIATSGFFVSEFQGQVTAQTGAPERLLSVTPAQ